MKFPLWNRFWVGHLRPWVNYLRESPHRERCEKPLGIGVWCGRGHGHPGPHRPKR